ncbi:hypothetical protein PHYPSEUDO_002234 [Phytophthora pseudosyringae]|uniref:No apical meristem-associated C-terminal domain-containing protein n=1 Tax=Phytophthora pseudosyringae TaxID=221518 RepID=A0A8T1VU89_9STRA|nr:hypothetical protein PHYPSEUDO_002234 [Phytophthora pseudosyringae]
MAGAVWTPEELWWLVQAWRETVQATKSARGKTRKMSSSQFNKLVHERFVAFAGGSIPRSVGTIALRKDILQHSYAFIRSFVGNKEASADLDWFVLTKSEQRELMKTAGGQPVQPIEERVFFALDRLLSDEITAGNASDDSESGASESDGDSSEGDKYERGMRQKKRPAAKKTYKRVQLSGSVPAATPKSALEEETGELLSQKDGTHAKQKRRRVTPKSSSPKAAMKDILERQSQVLARFLEKRADERSQEHDRSRQEREADQKFWATETAKDRALLRELFADK